MELNIKIDIEAAIANALQPEKLQPILDKHITDAVTASIREATGYNSTFRSSIENQLKEALPHGLSLDDVAKFQTVLNGAMNRAVAECNASSVQLALEKAVKEVMPDVPPVIKLSELMKEARSSWNKVDDNEAFYAYFEQTEYGFGHLFLDSSENPGETGYSYSSIRRDRESQKHRAKHQIAFTKDGEVYSLRLDNKQITPTSRPDIIGRFESILMAMYVGRTRIEVDMDADDVEAASEAQYD